MEDIKALTECAECTWDYIDRLRMALASACKERDELKKAYDAMARDLKFRTGQVRELQEDLAVCEAAKTELWKQLVEYRKELHEAKSELRAMKNELCLMCGKFREAHNGACNGCRWEKR